jgi:hypothetical protein
MVSKSRFPITILSALALLALAELPACAFGARETGAIRELGGFDSVSFSTAGQLFITQGDREVLEITASPAELPKLVTEVRGGTLFIGRREGGPAFSLRPPVFRLTMRKLTAIQTHSSGSVASRGLSADSLRIQISSSGGAAIEALSAGSLEVQLSSSGSLKLAGSVERQDVRLSSSGSYSAGSLESRTARVRVSSSGSATLRVSDSLEASLTSSGGVRYYGNPPQVNAEVTSSGRLVRLGD